MDRNETTGESEMKEWQVMGINDDEDTCSECGKVELQRVVWLQNELTGELIHVGTVCAARLQKIPVKEQRKAEKDFIKAAIKTARSELSPLRRAYFLHMEDYNTAVSKAHSDRSVPFAERMRKVHNDPRVLASDNAKNDLEFMSGKSFDRLTDFIS